MNTIMNLSHRLIRKLISGGAVAGLLCFAPSVSLGNHEAGNQWQKTDWDSQHIIVFSECGYAGRSKNLPVGDYDALRKVGVEHNAISSVIIPQGMAVEIFQGREFGGHWYRLNQSQTCLKGNWNNRIGSMRVIQDNPQNSYGFADNYQSTSTGCHNYTVQSADGEGAVRFVDKADSLTPVRPGRPLQGELCDNGPVRVELARRDRRVGITMNVADQELRFEPWSAYDNFSNNWYRKYMTVTLPQAGRNNGGGQNYGRNGWGNTQGFGKRYSSGVDNGDNWGNNYRRNWHKAAVVPAAVTKVYADKDCVDFSAAGNHKDTGVRFLVGDRKFYRIGDGSIKQAICHKGNIKVELAKKKQGAEVVLQVNGKTIKFDRGDSGDRYEHDWYRKYYTVNVR